MNNKKFYVSGIEKVGKVYEGDDPWMAIKSWINAEPKDRLSVSIQARDNDAAKELIQTACDHLCEVFSMAEQCHVSYRKHFLGTEIRRMHEAEKLISWPYDQVDPFSMG